MVDTITPVPKDVAIMRIAVSLVLLVGGFMIVTSPNFLFSELSQDLHKAAIGWIGMIVGYWLS